MVYRQGEHRHAQEIQRHAERQCELPQPHHTLQWQEAASENWHGTKRHEDNAQKQIQLSKPPRERKQAGGHGHVLFGRLQLHSTRHHWAIRHARPAPQPAFRQAIRLLRARQHHRKDQQPRRTRRDYWSHQA